MQLRFYSFPFIIHILPMRNWNPLCLCPFCPTYSFTSYLWGIETLVGRKAILTLFEFTSYLWGIETVTLFQCSYEALQFTSYLWGIETLLRSILSPKFVYSHPTYEELKLSLRTCRWRKSGIHILPMRNWNTTIMIRFLYLSKFTSYLWGIETEDDEWVVCFYDGFTSYLWGIETGLFCEPIGCSWWIHILPMRNWNRVFTLQATRGNPFTSYLWGIETLKNILLLKSWERIHILPMRNWNWPFSSYTSFVCFYSHPTYEELKLLQTWKRNGARCVFTSYLWGIETHVLRNKESQKVCIHILPMRNWNKELIQAGQRVQGDSHPTYEELKPYVSLCKCLHYLHSHPTYEELKLCVKIHELPPSIIHILPMRNWNPICQGRGSCRLVIHILPMRNWNEIHYSIPEGGVYNSHPTYEELKLEGGFIRGASIRIHILPMRNWNTALRTFKEVPLTDSHPTYEELKRECRGGVSWMLWVFTSYLWGIETKLGSVLFWWSWWFTSYLWGIETRCSFQ